jgi:hypothetical protein
MKSHTQIAAELESKGFAVVEDSQDNQKSLVYWGETRLGEIQGTHQAKLEWAPRIQNALDLITGAVDGAQVVYEDKEKFFRAPIEDVADLADLIEHEDAGIAQEAYSHWSNGTNHAECDRNGKLFDTNRLIVGDRVEHTTAQGDVVAGIIRTIEGNLLCIDFDDGEEGWESLTTCKREEYQHEPEIIWNHGQFGVPIEVHRPFAGG